MGTLADAPTQPLHVYFGAGLLPPLYHYTDYSRVLTSAALASLPPQNWLIEQLHQQQQQQQWCNHQRWLDQEKQRLQQQQQQQQAARYVKLSNHRRILRPISTADRKRNA